MADERCEPSAFTPDDLEAGSLVIKLSAADWEKFIEVLAAPPPPNDALKQLMREFGRWKDATSFAVEE